jgi:hypothetical protein
MGIVQYRDELSGFVRRRFSRCGQLMDSIWDAIPWMVGKFILVSDIFKV